METNLIPAPIDEKNIVSDFLNDFMGDYDDKRDGVHTCLVGAPIGGNKLYLYLCEWNHGGNWVRFSPIQTLINTPTRADHEKLVKAFMRDKSEGIVMRHMINDSGIYFTLFFKG